MRVARLVGGRSLAQHDRQQIIGYDGRDLDALVGLFAGDPPRVHQYKDACLRRRRTGLPGREKGYVRVPTIKAAVLPDRADPLGAGWVDEPAKPELIVVLRLNARRGGLQGGSSEVRL
jgi:hypothetical protein